MVAVTDGSLAEVQHVVVQSQGTGEAYLVAGFLPTDVGGCYLTRYSSAGVRDTTFGTDGDGVIRLFEGDANGRRGRGGLLVDAAGRIVWAGTSTLTTTAVKGRKATTQTASVLTVVRFNADGDLDTTFGGTGIVRSTVADQGVNGVVALSDGRLVVVGRNLSGRKNAWVERTVLVCLDADGSLDTGFGEGGVVYDTEYSSPMDVRTPLAVQSGDRILVASKGAAGGRISRYAPNGALDVTFGSAGRLVAYTDAGLGHIVVDPSTDALLALGGSRDAAGFDYAVVSRYGSNGSPDGGFGTGGRVTLTRAAQGQDLRHGGLALDANGAVFVGCTLIAPSATGNGTSVARLLPTGALDAGFGVGGFAALAGSTSDPLYAGLHLATRTTAVADGVLVAGAASGGGAYVVRYAR